MTFPKRLLIPNEELILDLRPHPVALALPVLVVVAELAAAIWLTLTFDFSSWIWWAAVVVIFVVYPLRRLIWWLTSNFAVTTDRVIHREGFIAKRSMEIPLEAINDVRFDQGIWDRMVGAGTLRISSASEFGTNTFTHIRHPEEVQKTIYHQGELNKKRMYLGESAAVAPAAPAAPASPPGAPSATSELERLAKLRDDGVLTEQEFQTQKAKILGQG
ncbi:MAG TPA: PH domain-containing protein [Actinomycetota bacterium]|nr:PH domain-containing protein [Actinomycetota bacterium]